MFSCSYISAAGWLPRVDHLPGRLKHSLQVVDTARAKELLEAEKAAIAKETARRNASNRAGGLGPTDPDIDPGDMRHLMRARGRGLRVGGGGLFPFYNMMWDEAVRRGGNDSDDSGDGALNHEVPGGCIPPAPSNIG